jgi:hypothetical protein
MQAIVSSMATAMVFVLALLVWAWTKSPFTTGLVFTVTGVLAGGVVWAVCEEMSSRR